MLPLLIEGLVQNDITLLAGDGLFLIPPDSRSNTQRIFLPRQAVVELDVLAVVRPGVRPAARRGTRDESAETAQESLFKQQNSTQ